jgi:hypothetical protein
MQIMKYWILPKINIWAILQGIAIFKMVENIDCTLVMVVILVG